jgi:hypothetical protein
MDKDYKYIVTIDGVMYLKAVNDDTPVRDGMYILITNNDGISFTHKLDETRVCINIHEIDNEDLTYHSMNIYNGNTTIVIERSKILDKAISDYHNYPVDQVDRMSSGSIEALIRKLCFICDHLMKSQFVIDVANLNSKFEEITEPICDDPIVRVKRAN